MPTLILSALFQLLTLILSALLQPAFNKAAEQAEGGHLDRAAFLTMIGLIVAGAGLFIWLVRSSNQSLRDDLKERDQTLVAIVKESVSIMTAVKITMDAAAVERQVLINKVDALESIIARLEMTEAHERQDNDRLYQEVKRLAENSADAAKACARAAQYVPDHLYAPPEPGDAK